MRKVENKTVGQQTQQSDRVYLRGLQLRRPYLVRAPTANHRPAASSAAAFAWDRWTGRHRRGVSKVGQKMQQSDSIYLRGLRGHGKDRGHSHSHGQSSGKVRARTGRE